MKDRAMQALHMLGLEPVAESTADWNSYGFRPERCTADAIGHLFNVLSKGGSAEWVLEGDIKGCFDNISHEWMLKNVHTDTKVLAKWLRAGVVDEGRLFPTKEGTPQGGIISPVLANLVLDGLEDLLGSLYGSSKLDSQVRRQLQHKVHFVRYADDFVITSNSKERLDDEIRPLVREFLAERGLTLSEEKTRVTHISDGFDFLGQNVRVYQHGRPNAIMLIKPSKKNVKTFLEGIRDVVRGMRTAKPENVIRQLNPKIQGWANYHRHVVAKETFSKVDNEIWQVLWRWALRRHPNKSRTWIFNRYFHKVGDRHGVFSCKVVREDGSDRSLVLKNSMSVEIKRHVKIQGAATPFDPSFEEYFEARSTVKMENNLAGRRKLLYLWKRQKGLCPICEEKITTLTRWHSHHVIRRVDGGSDSSSNLLLLHPACHMQHHASGSTVVLPVEH